MNEIDVPKHLRQFMLEGARETKLGDKKGAKKQYRYGNLHIREYDDQYTVHMDKYDPRSDPIRHLVWDAPEVLIGLAGAIIGGSKVGSYLYNKNKNANTHTHTQRHSHKTKRHTHMTEKDRQSKDRDPRQ